MTKTNYQLVKAFATATKRTTIYTKKEKKMAMDNIDSYFCILSDKFYQNICMVQHIIVKLEFCLFFLFIICDKLYDVRNDINAMQCIVK